MISSSTEKQACGSGCGAAKVSVIKNSMVAAPLDLSSLRPITVTESAAKKIQKMLQDEDSANYLRISVSGGGCKGLKYDFELVSATQDDDILVEAGPVHLAVDPMSYEYLGGAKIDFLETASMSRFVVRNLNVQTTSGCGSSCST